MWYRRIPAFTLLATAYACPLTAFAEEILAISSTITRYDSSGNIVGTFAPELGRNWGDAVLAPDTGMLYLLAGVGPTGVNTDYGRIWSYESATGFLAPITPRPVTSENYFRGIAISNESELLGLTHQQIRSVVAPVGGPASATVNLNLSNAQTFDTIEYSSVRDSIFVTNPSSGGREYDAATGNLLRFNVPITGWEIQEGPDGNLYSAGFGIRRLDPITGTSQLVGSSIGSLNGVTFEPNGMMLYSNPYDRHIYRTDPMSGSVEGQFSNVSVPFGIGAIHLETVPDGFFDHGVTLMPDPFAPPPDNGFTFPPVEVVPGVGINFDPPVVLGYDFWLLRGICGCIWRCLWLLGFWHWVLEA